MDEILMLHGAARWCGDCAAQTVFLPVVESGEGESWCCTACDAAIVLTILDAGVARVAA